MPIFKSNIKSIILLVVFCLSTFLVFGNAHAEDSGCTQLADKKLEIEKKVAELEAENESIVDTIIDIVKTVIGYAEPVNVSLSGSAKDLEKVKDVIEEVNGDLDTAGGLIGKFKKDSEGLLAALKESQAALKKVAKRTEQVRKIVAKTAKRLEKAIENTKKALHWVAEIRLLMKESDAARLSHGKELVATLCGVLDAAEVGSKAIIPLAHITQTCKGLTGILEDLVFINATMLKRNQQLIDAGVKFDLYPHALSDKPQEDPERAERIKEIRRLNQEIRELNEKITDKCYPIRRSYAVARKYCNKHVGDPLKLSNEHYVAQFNADKAREEFDQRWKDVPSTEENDRAISELEADKTNNERKIKGLLRQMQSARGPRLNAIADKIRSLQEENRHIDAPLKKLKGQ
ncbi:MAG: hypothetical protein JRJ21_05165, partial [Deltaproteobacteria bacterium]|nr:hypothetical protein [Deltaproteobacteria bacterium]